MKEIFLSDRINRILHGFFLSQLPEEAEKIPKVAFGERHSIRLGV
jgi:hypothetical protein